MRWKRPGAIGCPQSQVKEEDKQEETCDRLRCENEEKLLNLVIRKSLVTFK